MNAETSVADSSLLELPLRRLSGALSYGVGFAAIVLLWSVAALVVAKRSFLPGPVDTLHALERLADNGVLARHLVSSLVRVLVGFGLGAAAGMALGILVGLSSAVERAVEPVVELFRSVPPYAMIPLALLAFGVGASGKLFVLAYATFFPVLVSTVSGIGHVDRKLVEAALTLGASRRFTVHRVLIPAAIPQMVGGLRLGFGAAWLSLVAAEMVASADGLGFLIADAREMVETEVVVAGMVVIGVLGYVFNRVFVTLERRVGAR